MGIFWRWFGAFVLLAATFNPTEWNYVRWAMANHEAQLPLTVFLGLLLAIGWIICINATLNSIGVFGMLLVAAVFGALVWVLLDWGVLDLANTRTNLWLGILALSLILGIGLSWSILQKRLTGQVDVDEIDDR
jgi:hypothetical protein